MEKWNIALKRKSSYKYSVIFKKEVANVKEKDFNYVAEMEFFY